jgi:hypothetical protein
MSEWETIAPRAGQRTKPDSISVGWRKVSANHFRAVVTLSRKVLDQLGIQPGAKGDAKPRLLVQRSRATHQLRLIASEAPEAWAVHPKDGCATVAVPLDEVTLETRQPARPVAHHIDGRALVLTLPDWAREAAKAPPPTRVAIPLAEPGRRMDGKPLAPTSRHIRNSDPPKPRDLDPNCPLAKLPPDDLAEARDMMRRPQVGARALHDHFGWPLPEAIKIAAAIRDEMALAGRAA